MDSDDVAYQEPGQTPARLGRSPVSLPVEHTVQDGEPNQDALTASRMVEKRPVSQPITLQSFATVSTAPRDTAFEVAPAPSADWNRHGDNTLILESHDKISTAGYEEQMDRDQAAQDFALTHDEIQLTDEVNHDWNYEAEFQRTDITQDLNVPETAKPDEVNHDWSYEAEFQRTDITQDLNVPETTKPNKVEYFAKQIRQTRKLTDEVLIKRTQYTQELDRLGHCRTFLSNSTAELMSLLRMQHSFGPRSVHPRERQLEMRRVERTQNILKDPPPRPNDVASPPMTDMSPASIGEKAPTAPDSGTSGSKLDMSPVMDTDRVYDQYCKDYDAVLEQEEIVKKLTNDLSTLEFRLEKKHQAIKDRLYSQTLAADLRSEMLDPGLDVSESSFPARTGSVTPPLVRQYFDRQGDIGIFRERLIELDYTHEEGRMEREFLRDRGDPVDPPDSQFEFNYTTRRQHILDELQKAQEDVVVLGKQCDTAGFDTEIHRESMHSRYSEDSPARSEQEIREVAQPTPASVQIIHMPAPIPPSGRPERSAQRVDDWLRELAVVSPTGDPDTLHNGLQNPTEVSLAAFELDSFDSETFSGAGDKTNNLEP